MAIFLLYASTTASVAMVHWDVGLGWLVPVPVAGLIGGWVLAPRARLAPYLAMGPLGSIAAIAGINVIIFSSGGEIGDHWLVVTIFFGVAAILGFWIALGLGHVLRRLTTSQR